MELLWKAAGIAVLTVILSAAMEKKERDIAVVLAVIACCGIAGLAIRSLSDVIGFLGNICRVYDYPGSFVGIMLKITGVAVVTEMTAMISTDAGYSSLEKAMQFLGNAAILSLALPLFESFAEVVQEILNFV